MPDQNLRRRGSQSEDGVHASVNDLRPGDAWEIAAAFGLELGLEPYRLDILDDAFLYGGNWWIAVYRRGHGMELVRAIPLLNEGRRL